MPVPENLLASDWSRTAKRTLYAEGLASRAGDCHGDLFDAELLTEREDIARAVQELYKPPPRSSA